MTWGTRAVGAVGYGGSETNAIIPNATPSDVALLADLTLGAGLAPRNSMVGAVVGSYLYVGGGWDATPTGYHDWWKVNLATGAITALADIPLSPNIGDGAVALIGTVIYIAGGDGWNSLVAFDTATETWNTGLSGLFYPDLSGRQLGNASGVEIGGKLYVFGGFDYTPNAYVNHLGVYNPATNTWVWTDTWAGDAPTGRGYHAAVAYGGKMYVFGGYSGSGMADCWVYDPGTAVWTQLADIPTVLGGNTDSFGQTVVIGDRAFLSTGHHVLEYRFASDEWFVHNGLWDEPHDYTSWIDWSGATQLYGFLGIDYDYTTDSTQVEVASVSQVVGSAVTQFLTWSPTGEGSVTLNRRTGVRGTWTVQGEGSFALTPAQSVPPQLLTITGEAFFYLRGQTYDPSSSVQTNGAVPVGATTITIDPAPAPIAAGTVIDFGGTAVLVVNAVAAGATTIVVYPVAAPIPDNTVGTYTTSAPPTPPPIPGPGPITDAGIQPVRIPYVLKVVTKTGTVVAELPMALVTDVTWELNKPGQISFTLPMNDVTTLSAQPFTEVQLWRGTSPIFWGVITRPQAGPTEVTFQAPGLLWYFSRRNFGDNEPHNWVNNGDFESSMAGWKNVRANNSMNPNLGTAERRSDRAVSGDWAVRLSQNVTEGDNWLNYEFQHIAPSDREVIWTAVAWFYLESFTGRALEGRGLQLERFSTTKSEGHGIYYVDKYTPLGYWIKAQASMIQPRGTTNLINVRLYMPNGVIWWDRVSLYQNEALYFTQDDQAAIEAALVQHAQDSTYGKSDLNIGTYTPASGVLRDRTYQFSEAGRIGEAMEEFTQLKDGLDYSIAITGTSRTFTTHFPRRGTRVPFTLQLGVNIESFTWSYDGEQAANQIRVLGKGSGSTREIGFAEDVTVFSDGLTIENVVSAPDETPGAQLGELAQEALRVLKNPTILEVTTYEGGGGVIGRLWEGDTVEIIVDWGYVSVDAVYRVVALRLDPAMDRLTLTLNKEPA
jgi:hypothetical protein